jgi:two-component system nitrate/nitrite response regulator NarL
MPVVPQPSDGRGRVRVLLASDLRLLTDGFSRDLALSDRVEVVAVADSAARALEHLGTCDAAVVLVDLSMSDAMYLVRAVRASNRSAEMVIFAVANDDRAILACIEAGAAGYVLRDSSLADLVETIESVARGEARCTPRLAACLFRRVATLSNGSELPQGHAVLTPRERQIVELISQGLSNREIATLLGIELPTTKNHVHNILEKLRLHRRGQVTARVEGRVPEPALANGSRSGSTSGPVRR